MDNSKAHNSTSKRNMPEWPEQNLQDHMWSGRIPHLLRWESQNKFSVCPVRLGFALLVVTGGEKKQEGSFGGQPELSSSKNISLLLTRRNAFEQCRLCSHTLQ